jgi:hypothetical protein
MRLTTRALAMSVACLALPSLLVSPVAAQSDPQVGVWRLNVSKSTYSPGPAPKTATTIIEAAGAGTKVIVRQVLADGTTRNWQFTANYDGNDSPVTGNPDADTVARTRIDATTVQTTSKKGGKAMATQTSVVSADGKTRTVTTKGVNAKGEELHNVAVYEKL